MCSVSTEIRGLRDARLRVMQGMLISRNCIGTVGTEPRGSWKICEDASLVNQDPATFRTGSTNSKSEENEDSTSKAPALCHRPHVYLDVFSK